METTIKLREAKTSTYYSSEEPRERLVRFFNALYNTADGEERQRLIETMGFARGRSKDARELWSYDLGSDHVKIGDNNYNPLTGNFAHGKALDRIPLARMIRAECASQAIRTM